MGKKLLNITIRDFLETLNNELPVIISSCVSQESIYKSAVEIGIKRERIIKLYSKNYPRY